MTDKESGVSKADGKRKSGVDVPTIVLESSQIGRTLSTVKYFGRELPFASRDPFERQGAPALVLRLTPYLKKRSERGLPEKFPLS